MDKTLLYIINGTLLGDATIFFCNCRYKKYFSYKLSAKDRKFLIWIDNTLKTYKINNSWITKDKRNETHALYFYINSCPYSELVKLRLKWYTEREGMNVQKIVPRDLELNSTVLLHWYLGDGSLPRRLDDKNIVPTIVLATNCFLEEDIDFLILKLKELNLNFYKVRYKSGFTGKECGYCLYSKTQDGTPFRFFKLIGLECPKEIVNCTTGSKGLGSKVHYFKDKWPTEDEWIRIMSNVDGIGRIIKERRIEMNLTNAQLAQVLGRDFELERLGALEFGWPGSCRKGVNKFFLVRFILLAVDIFGN